MKEQIYKIRHFAPNTNRDCHMDTYNFEVLLSLSFAQKLLQKPYPEGEIVTKIGEKTLAYIFGKEDGLMHIPYTFINTDGKPSCLIHYVTVPGNACGLGIPFADVKQAETSGWVIYCTHNVDTIQQSYALLSLWLTWMNAMILSIESEEQNAPK